MTSEEAHVPEESGHKFQLETELTRIADQLKQGKGSSYVTPRWLLALCGFQRRSFWNTAYIRGLLVRYELVTVPDFEYAYIDGRIEIRQQEKDYLTSPLPSEDETSELDANDSGVLDAASTPIDFSAKGDPTYRIGKLRAANNSPTSIKPQTMLREAVTLMMINDFSQLPIMTSDREVKGMLSWESIGRKLGNGSLDSEAQDFMVAAREVSSESSIFSAVREVIAYGSVLVRDKERKINGIITTSDLSEQFHQLSEPFLLLGEIENHVRNMIANKFSKDEITAVRKPEAQSQPITDISDLEFGDYIFLMNNEERWTKVGLRVDRKVFVANLDEVRRIRNDVMHFDPDGIAESDLDKLRNFVRFLQTISESIE